MLESASRALFTGIAALGLVLLLAILGGKLAMHDVAYLLMRGAHVFAAMVWVGLIWYVNWVQLVALESVDEQARKTILTAVAARTSYHVGMAANLTVVTGAVLLVAAGYLTQRPLTSALWLWAGVIGALAMTGFVHAKIRPALRVLVNPAITSVDEKAQARVTLRTFARINLLLAFPVTFAMLAGAHG